MTAPEPDRFDEMAREFIRAFNATPDGARIGWIDPVYDEYIIVALLRTTAEQAEALWKATSSRPFQEMVEECARLKAWVADLQSGMYVNCVYCGHRYGPGETTPVSMADALKAHVEACPEHPMSRLKARLADLVEPGKPSAMVKAVPSLRRNYLRWKGQVNSHCPMRPGNCPQKQGKPRGVGATGQTPAIV